MLNNTMQESTDSCIQSISALIGRPMPNELDCELFALPARLGELGIEITWEKAKKEFLASMNVCKALTK